MGILNSGLVDVGIALIYVFVLVSVLVSAVNELLSGLLKQRATSLYQGIGELLQSGALRDQLYGHSLIRTLAPPTSSFKRLFRGAPAASATPSAMTGPSYIPKAAFSTVLVDLLGGTEIGAIVRAVDKISLDAQTAGQSAAGGGRAAPAELADELQTLVAKATVAQINPLVVAQLNGVATAVMGGRVTDLHARLEPVSRALGAALVDVMSQRAAAFSTDLAQVLRLIAADAPATVEQVRAAIESWFDAGMDRVAGWYKRWTQLWQFLIGFVLAMILNINIGTIGVTLWTDIPLRNAIVADAEKFAQNPPPGLWVSAPKSDTPGDFDVTITTPFPNVNNEKDGEVLVAIDLREPAPEEIKIDVQTKNLKLDLGTATIAKGQTHADLRGKVDRLPTDVSIVASYTLSGVAKKAAHTVTVLSGPGARIDRTRELLGKTMLPIGWPKGFCPEAWMLPGWILTAIGASFGAPFWFDLLNRVVQLRSGGTKPNGSKQPTNEASDTPK